MAWYGVRAASLRGAALAGLRLPRATSNRAEGTSMYSAIPPSNPAHRRNRRLGPVLAVVLHRALTGMAAAAAPGAVHGDGIAFLESRDALPSSATHPAFSWPSVNGGVNPRSSSITCRSEWHTPAPPILTRICPGPGDGLGTSSSRAGWPTPTNRTACMMNLLGSSLHRDASDYRDATTVSPARRLHVVRPDAGR